jgi:hypothetical protein
MRQQIARLGAAMLCALAIDNGTAYGANRPEFKARPHNSATCTGAGYASFVGGHEENLAAGDYSAVLGGTENLVCDASSGIGSGNANNVTSHGKDSAYESFIAGGFTNLIETANSFIGAGSFNTESGDGGDTAIVGGTKNAASGAFGFIGDGQSNSIANAEFAVIGGGSRNVILRSPSYSTDSAGYSAIAGGSGNSIVSFVSGGAGYGFIGAGENNAVSGEGGVVAGGMQNQATGYFATVPGGNGNTASGVASFAAGNNAQALTTGSFVWSDDTATTYKVTSTKSNQFLARATGGFAFYTNPHLTSGVSLAPGSGTWSSLSDRTMKTGIAGIDDASILAKVAALPVSEWSYTSERGVRHIGPMAQDFYAAFRVGEDDRHITTIDEDGVALAAVKALHAENASLRSELKRLERRVAALER